MSAQRGSVNGLCVSMLVTCLLASAMNSGNGASNSLSGKVDLYE